MNSINHSLKSFDSCGRAFLTILSLRVKLLSHFTPRTILLFFQVLGYLMICLLRRSRKAENIFCQNFQYVSNLL